MSGAKRNPRQQVPAGSIPLTEDRKMDLSSESELGHGGAVIGSSGIVCDADQLGMEIGQAGGADLGNLNTVSGQTTDLAGDVSKDGLLEHGAPSTISDSIIVPLTCNSVNPIHLAVRKYVAAGIAIYASGEDGKTCLKTTTDLAAADELWQVKIPESAGRVEASRKAIEAAQKTVSSTNEAIPPLRENAESQRKKVDSGNRWLEVGRKVSEGYDPSTFRVSAAHARQAAREYCSGELQSSIKWEKELLEDAEEAYKVAANRRAEAFALVRAEEAKIAAEPKPPTTVKFGSYDYTALTIAGADRPLPETLNFPAGTKRIYIFKGCDHSGKLGEGIQAEGAYGIELPLDVPGVLTIADAPAWIEEAWWGEEYRGAKLDSPEAIAAAKRYLARAAREEDGPHRIAKDLAKVERQLKSEDLWDHEREQLEQKRDRLEEEEPDYETTGEVAEKLIDLGLSQVRATTLMRVHWNPRNKPALPDALLRELVANAWEGCFDWPAGVKREWRWQFRNWVEPGSLDDLLTGEIAEKDWLLGQSLLAAGSRTMLYGPTGKGKTMVCLSIALRICAGLDFVHWQGSEKPRRVLYVDGDMGYDDMRVRVRQEVARMGGGDLKGFKLVNHEKFRIPKLDTQEGQFFIDTRIEEHGADLVVFDNVQALLSDTGKEAWSRMLDWTKELTDRGIAQLWQHHTGHNENHAFDTKTREWGLDNVIHLRTHKAEPAELIVSLAFEKVRGIRTAEHDTVQLRLAGEKWHSSGGGSKNTKVAAERVEMLQDLLVEHGHVGEATAISEPEFAKLIAGEGNVDQEYQRLRNCHNKKTYAGVAHLVEGTWKWYAA